MQKIIGGSLIIISVVLLIILFTQRNHENRIKALEQK